MGEEPQEGERLFVLSLRAQRNDGPLCYRLFLIGIFISSALISRTNSGTPQANAGSFLILKWYMSCIAWWSSLRKVILPLGVSKLMPSMVLISVLAVASPFDFFNAVTIAMAALKPPAVKKSGGALNCL